MSAPCLAAIPLSFVRVHPGSRSEQRLVICFARFLPLRLPIVSEVRQSLALIFPLPHSVVQFLEFRYP